MKTRFLVVVVAVLVGLIMTSCATYNTKGAMPVMSRIDQKKLVMVEKDGVEITVFPILNKEDSEKYFDENILDNRMLAVYLDVLNKTTGKVKLTSSYLEVGQMVVGSSPANVMYKVVKRNPWGRAYFWMYPTFFVGGPISAIHTYTINKEIEADIKEKQIGFSEIEPMGISEGFLWFKIPASPEDKDDGLPNGLPRGMTLGLKFKVGQEEKTLEIKIP